MIHTTFSSASVLGYGVSEIEISYKTNVPASQRKQVKSSSDAAAIFRDAYPAGQIEYREIMFVMFLTRASKVLAIYKLSEGGTAGTVADIKMIIQCALKINAHGLILCHNHPSGNLKPSHEDISTTKKIVQAAKLLEISVLDHIILTAEAYTSLMDEGNM